MRKTDLFLIAFLALQIAIPLHYYGGFSDPYDERFAWRMFSPTRMARCEFRFVADGQQVRVGEKFHQAWLHIARRGRKNVIERMAQTLCSDEAINELKLTMICVGVDNKTDNIASGGFDLCSLGGL